jgi:hypothetical protein
VIVRKSTAIEVTPDEDACEGSQHRDRHEQLLVQVQIHPKGHDQVAALKESV